MDWGCDATMHRRIGEQARSEWEWDRNLLSGDSPHWESVYHNPGSKDSVPMLSE
jgi:hypothetical protein